MDAIYSGFLSSAEQITCLLNFISQFRREGILALGTPVLEGVQFEGRLGELIK